MSIESSLDHIWHSWINLRQATERESNPDHQWEHSLYEFKSMLNFLSYGHHSIQKAFEGKLPTIHKQCSRTPSIPILNNTLKCALGNEVTTCPILLQLKETFDNRGKFYEDIPSESVFGLMAKTCAWHIYCKLVQAKEGWGGVDTSEGWMMDNSDRMFWDNIYRSMRQDGPDDEHLSPFPTGVEA